MKLAPPPPHTPGRAASPRGSASFFAKLDGWLHPSIRAGEAKDLASARLTLAGSVFGLVLSVPIAVLRWVQFPPVEALPVTWGLLGFSGVIFLLWRGFSPRACVVSALGWHALGLGSEALLWGDFTSPGLVALTLFPLAGTWAAGRREGNVVFAGVLLVFVAVYSINWAVHGTSDARSLAFLFGLVATAAVGWGVGSAWAWQRAEVEVDLRNQGRRAELGLAAARAGVLMWEEQGDSLYANERLRAILGLPERSSLTLRAVWDRIAPQDRPALSHLVSAPGTVGDHHSLAIEFCTPAGPVYTACDLLVEGTQPGERRFVASFRDVSELHRMLRVREELLSTVSHEIRSPLTAVHGAVHLLSVMGARTPDETQVLRIALNNGERVLRLVDDLLDYQRSESGLLPIRIEELDLATLVRQVVAARMPTAPAVRLSLPPAPVLLRSDGQRLGQVLANLLSNAERYTPASAQIEVRVLAQGAGARLEVQDYGEGIPAAFRPHVFERFVQGADSSRSGSGLGLHISKSLTERLGGRIGFVTSTGKGTTFWLELPAEAPLEAVGARAVALSAKGA